MSVCWHLKKMLESGPVAADLTTIVVQCSCKSLLKDIKPVHSLTHSINNSSHVKDGIPLYFGLFKH